MDTTNLFSSHAADPPRVIYVHGLFMSGHESLLLSRRLRRHDLRLERFTYGSRREEPERIVQRLAERLDVAPDMHLLAHSLGGLIALAALGVANGWNGRALLLGSPLGGSETARRLTRIRAGKWLLGQAGPWLCRGIEGPALQGRVAAVAGIRNCGMGALIGACRRPGDGLVCVAETRSPGLWPRLARTTHLGLLLDRRVAAAAADYFLTGHLAAPRRQGGAAGRASPGRHAG